MNKWILSMMQKIGDWLQWNNMPSYDDLVVPVIPSVSPQNAPQAPITPKTTNPTLTQILTYMRDFEGVKFNPKTGKPDQNWRNNNPLNYRFYDPKETGTDIEYMTKYKPVKRSPSGFAVFLNYDIGWLYAINDKKNKIKLHPNWTLYDFINNHAPPEDNNPVDNYVSNVAKRAGVDKSMKVSCIVLS